MGQILVAIDTDAGLIGYGVGGGGRSAIHVVHAVMRDLLLGRDTEPIEAIWHDLYAATLPFGRKGIAIMALSGVDLALWDLRGKAANQSIAQLLGGPIHSAMPTYSTVWDDIPASLLGQHSAFKIHLASISTKPYSPNILRLSGSEIPQDFEVSVRPNKEQMQANDWDQNRAAE